MQNLTDEEYEFDLIEDIEGHNSKTLVINPEKGGNPWYCKWPLVIVCDFLLMGWLPRFLL